MKAGQNRQLVQLATTGKQWRESSLLIGGTSLILAGLSVGLALSTWRLLFQGLRQFNVLWTQQGVGGLGLLLLLIVQLLLSLAAWTLLIRIATREVIRLRAQSSEAEQQIFTQPMAPAIVPPLAVDKSPIELYPDAPTPPSQPGGLAAPGVQVTLMQAQSDANKVGVFTRAFLVNQRIVPKPPAQPSQAAAPGQMGQKPQMPSAPEVPLQRYASVSSDVPPEFQFQAKQASPSIQQKTQPKHGNSEELEDPFAVHQDVVNAFLQENPAVQGKEQAKQKQGANQPIQEFVFGNPFEGLLPDVFEHDEDLKRSVKERHLNSHPNSTPGNESPIDSVSKPSIFEHLQ